MEKVGDTELVRTLMDVAVMAIGRGWLFKANDILTSLSKARPESEIPWIGLSIVRLHANQPQVALKYLEKEALKRNPESQTAKALYGMALKIAGMSGQAESTLKSVVDTNSDEHAVALAEKVLEEINA